MRLRPTPRLVDFSLLLGVLLALATGIATAFAGTPSEWWVVALHGIGGILVIVFLAWKLARVRQRLHPDRWQRSTVSSMLALVLALGALATGVYWTLGGTFEVAIWNALMVHVFLGLLLVPALVLHLLDRFRTPGSEDFEGRRTALQYALLIAGGTLAWRAQRAVVAALGLFPSRRYTGSRERGEDPGNTFPVTMWVADDPDPIDTAEWTLRIEGAVERERTLDYASLLAAEDELRATLDCTSGWYTTQDWRGVRIARLLETARPTDDATWVRFRSVTGYRWSLPIGEARRALLATHVGDERLTHGHGSPARLVAPGRRGFQWVKWVESIEVRTEPDYGQWIAIFASGFTG